MTVAVVTGSGGLVGSRAVRHFAALGLDVVGVDNDMRGRLFGPDGSTRPTVLALETELGAGFTNHGIDIRVRSDVDKLLRYHGRDVSLVVHCAAQPAHDSQDPLTDWDINATGTANVLEATRKHAPDATVIVLSTIKVYGQWPNRLPLDGLLETRYEIRPNTAVAGGCAGWEGIDETMPIDGGPHSIFGASKTAADVFAQEYGHYLGLRTVILRGGCLTGPAHAAVEAHGFLAYLMRCVMEDRPYRVLGYGGKQVRDNIHTADVATALEAIWRDPPEPGSVFNLGGGRGRDVSILEALALAEEIVGRPAKVEHADARKGDHRWWITDMARFRARYPAWAPTYDVPQILQEIHDRNADRWRP